MKKKNKIKYVLSVSCENFIFQYLKKSNPKRGGSKNNVVQ